MDKYPNEVQKVVDLEKEALSLARSLASRRFDSKRLMRVYSMAVKRYHRRNRISNSARAKWVSETAPTEII